jgi:hypothetical protein
MDQLSAAAFLEKPFIAVELLVRLQALIAPVEDTTIVH